MDDIAFLIEEIKGFVNERNWEKYHTPKNLAISISIEANELLEHFQWNDPSFKEIKSNEEKFREISYEIADVFIYLLMFSYNLGIDVKKTIMEKLAIDRKKYPS